MVRPRKVLPRSTSRCRSGGSPDRSEAIAYAATIPVEALHVCDHVVEDLVVVLRDLGDRVEEAVRGFVELRADDDRGGRGEPEALDDQCAVGGTHAPSLGRCDRCSRCRNHVIAGSPGPAAALTGR